MALISIVGNVDKRIVAIPLARGLSIDGKTAIITDDSSYKRLYSEDTNVGTIDGIDIVIDYEINENSIDVLKETHEAYKHYVFVSNSYINKNSDLTILCRGRDRGMLSDSVAKEIGETDNKGKKLLESKEVIIANGKIDKKEMTNTIQMLDKYYRYLGNVEETKTLDTPNDSVLAKKIAGLVGDIAGINGSVLEKLINRSKVITNKEVSGRRRK